MTLGGVALLAGACDSEPVNEKFRAGPKLRPRSGSVEVGRAKLEQLLIDDRQRCSVPANMSNIAAVGQQVRITHEACGPALYTVDELRDDDNPDYVRMSLAARLRIGTTEGFTATMTNIVTKNQLSDAQAEAQSEFVERVVDTRGSSLIVVAPHGGGIETQTDMQAERLTAALAKFGACSWICKGWNQGGGAYDRWHIRSTDISPRSFVGLGTLSRRRYDYCVAFHGMDVGGVLIGGGGPQALKLDLAKAIRSATGNALEVGVADPTDIYDGDSEDNLVNWLTSQNAGGLQIEQSRIARLDYWDKIADAIAGVLNGVL